MDGNFARIINKKKGYHVILTVLLLLVCVKFEVEAKTDEQEPLAILYSASDFQNPDSPEAGMDELESIVKQIFQDGYEMVSEALICGDYNASDTVDEDVSVDGVEKIQSILEKYWKLGYDQISFVQGNHDTYEFDHMDETGPLEREEYSIYQINHHDFGMRVTDYINEEERLEDASAELKRWLTDKISAEYTKPIFIITHLPLHNSYRYDNSYSEHLFDVINEAAGKGLNIVYLFGHNHAKEYDNYLGGDAVYLSKGECINIPDVHGNGASSYKTKVLNFTYLNAGYLSNPENDLLSSCIFEVYEDRIEVSRYSKDGICNLKNAGVASDKDGNWEANENIVKSPQTILLHKEILTVRAFDGMVDEVVLNVGESITLAATAGASGEEVKWDISHPETAALEVDKRDASQAVISGKAYGTASVSVEYRGLKTTVKVIVMPKNAIRLSYSDKTRFFGVAEDVSDILKNGADRSEEYLILNKNTQGNAEAFAVQDGELAATEQMTVLYVPGVGEVVTPKVMKHVLWRFEKTEYFSEDAQEYYLRVSEKSPFRYKYYLSPTSEVDSRLLEHNANHMRFFTPDETTGAAVFKFELNEADELELITESHHNQEIWKNNNGRFSLKYDELNKAYVLQQDSSGKQIYFYRQNAHQISDVIFWTDAAEGNAFVDSELSKQTGGTIYIMHENVTEEIPITLEMLEGYENNVAGEYYCSVIYNGEVIRENYKLTMENNHNVFMRWLLIIKEWIFCR